MPHNNLFGKEINFVNYTVTRVPHIEATISIFFFCSHFAGFYFID